MATCIITNCRGRAPSGEPFCAKHRDKPKLATPSPVIETEGSGQHVRDNATALSHIRGDLKLAERSTDREAVSAREMLAREYDKMGLASEAKRLRVKLGCELKAETAAMTVIGRLAYLEAFAEEAGIALLPARLEPVVDGEPHPVIMIEVESAHDRHTYTFTSRPESEAFLAGARKFPGIAVTAIEERHVATAEYALGGLPEMLEAQVDD